MFLPFEKEMHGQRRLRQLQEGLLLERPTQTVVPAACAERLAPLTRRPASEHRCNTGLYASRESEMLMNVARLSVSSHWDTIRKSLPGILWAKHLSLECAAQHQTACQLRAPCPMQLIGAERSAPLLV